MFEFLTTGGVDPSFHMDLHISTREIYGCSVYY